MVIKADTSAVRETRWYEYLLRFVCGGLITAVTGVIAKEFGPVVGGLFLAFPAIFPATATLAEKHAREKKQAKGLRGEVRGKEVAALEALGTALGSAGGLLPFALVVWLVLTRSHCAIVLTAATIVWCAGSFAAWEIRRKL